jgi:hypothetical protein
MRTILRGGDIMKLIDNGESIVSPAGESVVITPGALIVRAADEQGVRIPEFSAYGVSVERLDEAGNPR